MKKISDNTVRKIIVMLFLIGYIFIFSLYAGSYSKKCIVCMNDYSKKHGVMIPNMAWRDFHTPIIHKDGKSYITYKCASGHKFLVCIKGEN